MFNSFFETFQKTELIYSQIFRRSASVAPECGFALATFRPFKPCGHGIAN
jgi:hypothetical protein